MRNSSLYRSNISDEKVAFLSEIKNQNDYIDENVNEPKTYKRLGKQKELDLLWQNFKINPKEEKSPGVYLLTGFIAGALCMFMMNALLSLGTISSKSNAPYLGQPKFEKKIDRKNNISKFAVVSTPSVQDNEINTPAFETYTVKNGDSISSIIYRFYGKYDLNKVEKIKKANNLSSVHKLSVGQELIIPMN